MFGASFQTFELVTDRYNDEELGCPLILGATPCDDDPFYCNSGCGPDCCSFVIGCGLD